MKAPPSIDDIEQLKQAGGVINSEWITYILLRHDAGVPPTARHLRRSDRSKGQLGWKTPSSDQRISLPLPPHVEQHLDTLQGESDYLCPWLHSLSNYEFRIEWNKVCEVAGRRVSMQVLSSRYRTEHQVEINQAYEVVRRGNKKPTREIVELLLQAAAKIHKDWVTLIVLVRSVGLMVHVARHLARSALRGDDLYVSGNAIRHPYWVFLDTDVSKYLRKLPETSAYFCPWLHGLSWTELTAAWRIVEDKAGVRVPLNALRTHFIEHQQHTMGEDRVRAQDRAEVSDDTIQQLKRVGNKISPDWVTFLLLTYDAGIIPSIARRLKRSARAGNDVICQARVRAFPYKCALPAHVAKHLDSLPNDVEHYCPWLNSLSNTKFRNEWQRLLHHAKRVVHLSSLTRGYRRVHSNDIKFRKSKALLEALAQTCKAAGWLSQADVDKLEAEAHRWVRLPAKNGQRARKKTRAQMLAGVSGSMKEERASNPAEASLLDALVNLPRQDQRKNGEG